MAACLVTFAGSGLLQLNWLEGDTPHSLRTGGGIVYIDDTADSVTYTTLTGNITASSGCLTINPQPFTYYKWGWRDIKADDHQVIGVVFNDEVMTEIDEVSFPETSMDLVRSINAGIDDRFKIVAYRRQSSGFGESLSVEYEYIVKTIGADEIYLAVRNDDLNELLYIVGYLFDIGDLDSTYKEVSECYPSQILI